MADSETVVESTGSETTSNGEAEASSTEQTGTTGGQSSETAEAMGTDGAASTEAKTGSDEDSIESVKGDDGEEYVPKKAFLERIKKLTEQRNSAQTSAHSQILESLKNDPEFKKKFVESLGGQTSAGSSEEPDESTPFDKWLEPLPKEYQATYRGFADSFYQTLEPQIINYVKSQLDPIMRHIGEEKVNSFSKTNPDFSKYKSKVMEIYESGRAKSLEDAYILASHEDKLKATSAAGAKQEAERQNKLKARPSGGSGMGALKTGKKPGSLREALESAADSLGMR